MNQTARRIPVVVAIELRCRSETVTLTLRHGDPQPEFMPLGKEWRTLRRGDLVRGPDGYLFTVHGLMLQQAKPPIKQPFEIESVAAWMATGLRR